MSTVIAVETRRTSMAGRLLDYLELTKPRITVMVLVTVVVSGIVAAWGQPDPMMLLNVALGTALVAASASALNQWLERTTDAKMTRTSQRPLPDQRLGSGEVVIFGTVTFVAGMGFILANVGWLTAFWALVTWAIYVLVYTPLKARTSWNTAIGAISGATPVFMGWTAVTPQFWDIRAVALFLVVFLWQFPHFMAIAWLYRDQYSKAGLKMTTVVDRTGNHAGVQAVLASLTLLPVSFLAGVGNSAYVLFVILVFPLGILQLACAVRFCLTKTEVSSRQLLRVSLVYLPTLLIMLMLLPWA